MDNDPLLLKSYPFPNTTAIMSTSNVKFLSAGRQAINRSPLPYTSNPATLVWEDVKLFFRTCHHIPGTVLPWLPFRSGPLDELYPSFANIFDLSLHMFLVIAQLIFLLSLPLLLLSPVPAGLALLYVFGFTAFNKAVCWLLNRGIDTIPSRAKILNNSDHDSEHWVFLNGVSVG